MFASVTALYQRKLKRLIGYSSISHIGFVITALSCSSVESVKSVIIYIFLYTLTSIALFGIIINSTTNGLLLKYLIN
jgi:NADH:ubiquinone oxidoreductase subunit 2 (subunit N)